MLEMSLCLYWKQTLPDEVQTKHNSSSNSKSVIGKILDCEYMLNVESIGFPHELAMRYTRNHSEGWFLGFGLKMGFEQLMWMAAGRAEWQVSGAQVLWPRSKDFPGTLAGG